MGSVFFYSQQKSNAKVDLSKRRNTYSDLTLGIMLTQATNLFSNKPLYSDKKSASKDNIHYIHMNRIHRETADHK